MEVVDFSRKHTANVHESLNVIRGIVERLVEKRDARRDGFASLMKKAMQTTLGADSDAAMKALTERGFTKTLAKEALEVAGRNGRLTIFAVVDALTRLSAKLPHAADRAEADYRAGRLLALAS